MDDTMCAIKGPRHVVSRGEEAYPPALEAIADPPEKLYIIGDVKALQEGLAIVGARRATPYGTGCARRFATRAAERGIAIISGGARGCDAAAHRAALDAGVPTVVFLGGGCDAIYPRENHGLFCEVVAAGGALVSERAWAVPPLPYMFRARNRLIAGLAKATLIVEAGLPSGTFSTADEALAANRDVLVVPGSIASEQSRGANRLIYQGATPIVDDDSFDDQLFALFGIMCLESAQNAEEELPQRSAFDRVLLDALAAEPMSVEALHALAATTSRTRWHPSKTSAWASKMEAAGAVTRYPGGRIGVVL